MRIAYIGNFKHSFCTEVHVEAELQSLGHQVLRLQEDDLWVPQADSQTREFGADLLLWTRTWSWAAPDQAVEWIAQLERGGIQTAGFTLDLLWGIREETIIRDPWFRLGTVFTADGGHDDAWRSLRINHVWSPPAVFSQEVGRGTPNPRYGHPVVFTGSQADGYHTQWPWRGMLLDLLEQTYGDDYFRYGPGSPRGSLRGQELADLYASARVVVGDSLGLAPHYWSDRVYEVTGRGGMLVHPRIPELVEQFGDSVLWYDWGDCESVTKAVDEALAWSEVERQEHTARAMLITSRDHTYRNRMQAMLDKLGES